MATTTIYWYGTSGDRITVEHPDSGNGEVVITSDPNKSIYTRSKGIMLTSVSTPILRRTFILQQQGLG